MSARRGTRRATSAAARVVGRNVRSPVARAVTGRGRGGIVEFNLADLFEYAVDNFGDREYLVADGRRRTYREMEERANRLAHYLAANGIGAGDHVGIYAYNCAEWVETLWAVFKLRAVWININYRYVEDELRYLFHEAHLKALVYQREFEPRVNALRAELPDLKLYVVIDEPDVNAGGSPDGDEEYAAALAGSHPARDFGPRSADDRYVLFTGGTTGMPKGVVWRHEDVFYALGGGVDAYTKERAEHPQDMVKRAAENQTTSFPIAPLMHGLTQWTVMAGSFVGNRIVLTARFEPHDVWRTVAQENVNLLMITGDAMGRPLVEALDDSDETYDTSSLFAVSSSAAVFSPTVKDEFFKHFPDLIMIDAIGSSETGMNGMTLVTKDTTAMQGGPTVKPHMAVAVLDENLEPVEAGSGVVGRLATAGNIPLEYLNDPVKTAATFVTAADGTRYAIPGDMATVEADGSITLLGRGSVSINSGGEKIYPEEVEAAVKSHPGVYDAVVVGVPDERWGQRVVAVVQLREGHAPTLDDIQIYCRTAIAGYKVPRELHAVAEITRSPSGKPDYRWALSVATSE
jgi:acyl-CoA synthetase (AMP-forming)/AMP-acid ligase II